MHYTQQNLWKNRNICWYPLFKGPLQCNNAAMLIQQQKTNNQTNTQVQELNSTIIIWQRVSTSLDFTSFIIVSFRSAPTSLNIHLCFRLSILCFCQMPNVGRIHWGLFSVSSQHCFIWCANSKTIRLNWEEQTRNTRNQENIFHAPLFRENLQNSRHCQFNFLIR